MHSLLIPENSTMIFIDHQPQITFGVASMCASQQWESSVWICVITKVCGSVVISQNYVGRRLPKITSQLYRFWVEPSAKERSNSRHWLHRTVYPSSNRTAWLLRIATIKGNFNWFNTFKKLLRLSRSKLSANTNWNLKPIACSVRTILAATCCNFWLAIVGVVLF